MNYTINVIHTNSGCAVPIGTASTTTHPQTTDFVRGYSYKASSRLHQANPRQGIGWQQLGHTDLRRVIGRLQLAQATLRQIVGRLQLTHVTLWQVIGRMQFSHANLRQAVVSARFVPADLRQTISLTRLNQANLREGFVLNGFNQAIPLKEFRQHDLTNQTCGKVSGAPDGITTEQVPYKYRTSDYNKKK